MDNPIVLGAIIGVAGTAVGAFIGLAAEPIKLWATQRSRKKNLRLALYGEIGHIVNLFSERLTDLIGFHGIFGDECVNDTLSTLTQSPHTGMAALAQMLGWEFASFDVYKNVKVNDPTLFYQLNDFKAIDATYLELRKIDTSIKFAPVGDPPGAELRAELKQLGQAFSRIGRFGLDETLLSKVSADPILNPSEWAQDLHVRGFSD